jgi:hypothetical protein
MSTDRHATISKVIGNRAFYAAEPEVTLLRRPGRKE